MLVEDVTELRRIEEEKRLDAITFETHEAIFICDNRNQILRMNRAFAQITGYNPSEVVGKPPDLIGPQRPDSNSQQKIHDTLTKHGKWQGETWSRRKSGQDFPIWLTLTAVKNACGIVTHFVGVFVDLSELRQHRETIERAAAEEMVLGDLLRLSHQSTALKDFLREALAALFNSVPWLKLEPQGAIFLCDHDGDHIILKYEVSLDMREDHSTLCSRVRHRNSPICCASSTKHHASETPSTDLTASGIDLPALQYVCTVAHDGD